MAALQNILRNYLQNKLNDTDASPFSSRVPFKLYDRYAIEDQDFYDVVLDSVDWEIQGSTGVLDNNVVVEYDGIEYNTQNGQYILQKIKYVPCIIEDFIADYEPLTFVENINYTIPITYYINETYNKQLNNLMVEATEQFGNLLRGRIDSVFDANSGKTFRMLLNHTALTPLTGIIDFNGTVFREYQMVVHIELIDNGYFGNQIVYNISVPKKDESDVVPFNGATFAVNPISATSTRASELHEFQVFGTNNFESKAMPNEVGFMLELSFLYDGGQFTKWLYGLKFNPSENSFPRVITVSVRYPGTTAQESPSKFYVIESIGGVEQVGEKIIMTIVLKPATTLIIPTQGA